jgi:TNF receptor-associated factor 4
MRYQRRNEKKHIAEDCMKNSAKCDFCKEQIPKSEEADHLEECPKFPIPCPAKCNVNDLPREEVLLFF